METSDNGHQTVKEGLSLYVLVSDSLRNVLCHFNLVKVNVLVQ